MIEDLKSSLASRRSHSIGNRLESSLRNRQSSIRYGFVPQTLARAAGGDDGRRETRGSPPGRRDERYGADRRARDEGGPHRSRGGGGRRRSPGPRRRRGDR